MHRHPFNHRDETSAVTRNRRHGFTLMELLVVIVIILILMGLLFPALMRARESARIRVAQTEVFELQKAWTAYWQTYGSFPTAGEMDASRVQLLAGANPDRIQFMQFSRRRLRDGMLDPWGEPYRVAFDVDADGLDTRWSFQTRAFLRNYRRD